MNLNMKATGLSNLFAGMTSYILGLAFVFTRWPGGGPSDRSQGTHNKAILIAEKLIDGQALKIVDCVAKGALTPMEGKLLLKAIEMFRKSIETNELKKQIELLEERVES